MTQTTIATDIHQTLDVHLDALTQVAFDLALRLKDAANAAQLVFTQIANASVEVDAGFLEHQVRTRAADAIDISKANLGSLIGR